MSVTPDQVVAVAKSNLEAGLKSSVAAMSTVLAAVESLSALNLNTARASFDDGLAYLKAVAAARAANRAALRERRGGNRNP